MKYSNSLKRQQERDHSIALFGTERDKIRVSKAVILAGGQMTRLHPLVKYYPLWMLPVLNRPLIRYSIDFLKRHGMKEIIIVLSGDDEIPPQLLSASSNGVAVRWIKEDIPRGPAGALKKAQEFIEDDVFLVLSSNFFAEEINLDAAIRFMQDSDSSAVVGVHRADRSCRPREIVDIEPDNSIRKFHIMHSSVARDAMLRSSGIYLFGPEVFQFIPDSGYMDIKEQLIPVLQKHALKVSAYEIEGSFYALDSIDDYVKLQREVLFEKTDKSTYANGYREYAESVWIGNNVNISPKANIVGPVLIGENSTIGDWAQVLGPTVIGSNCTISNGALVRDSIVWNNATLAAESKAEFSIICDKTSIRSGCSIQNMIVVKNFSIGDANLLPSGYSVKGVADLSLFTSITGTRQSIYRFFKRLMDAVLSGIGLVAFSPFMLLIAAAIRMDSKGPVFYTQKRCGINGRLFGMLKFRTMVPEAEKIHETLVAKKDIDGPMFKMVNDPRITRLGKFLRRSSLDELPQLFNVLKGEMSLVGPRPLIMDEMKFSSSWRDTRLKVKPGITGLWQIQGRSESSFQDWIKYDIAYVKNQALWLDIKILLKTLKAVLKKAGAY